MIRQLKRRLEALEHHAFARLGPWPPEAHTFDYHLWQVLGEPCERQSFWSMYQDRAEQFWRNPR
jgi:hypothetical protein